MRIVAPGGHGRVSALAVQCQLIVQAAACVRPRVVRGGLVCMPSICTTCYVMASQGPVSGSAVHDA